MRRNRGRVAGAILVIAVGLVLTVRPFTALTLLLGLLALAFFAAGLALIVPGAVRFSRRRRSPVRALPLSWLPDQVASSRGAQLALGIVAVGLGVGAVVWPGVTYTIFAYLPMVAAATYGVVVLTRTALRLRLRRRQPGQGLPPLGPPVLGLAALLAAVAGWNFPDVALMALAVGVGVTLILLGVRLITGPLRPHRRWRRALTALALPAAFGLFLASGTLAAHPEPGEFYDAPASADEQSPGTLLRAAPHPAPPGAQAVRILYSTTRDAGGTPALDSGVVYTPDGVVDAPVVVWAHGTTGVARGCAPSLNGVDTGAMFVLAELLAAGWAVVAPDYTGLATSGSHPYMIGQGQGRSVIDAARAAAQTDLPLGTQHVLWGHSQGGHAALWAGGLWPEYAPELTLDGVVALAPAANLPAIFAGWQDSKLTNILASYVVNSYGAEYDDVDPGEYIRPVAKATADAFAQRCLADPGTAVSLFSSLTQETPIWSRSEIDGPLGERAEENIPAIPIQAPLLIAQGEADTAVPPPSQDAFVADRCAQGWSIDYRTYEGLDHLPLVEAGSVAIDEAFLWTATLFAGAEVPPGQCG